MCFRMEMFKCQKDSVFVIELPSIFWVYGYRKPFVSVLSSSMTSCKDLDSVHLKDSFLIDKRSLYGVINDPGRTCSDLY